MCTFSDLAWAIDQVPTPSIFPHHIYAHNLKNFNHYDPPFPTDQIIQKIYFKNRNDNPQIIVKSGPRTCLLLVTESGKLRLRELVDPILRDIDPSNLWDNWCCWSAMDRAWRCKYSSSANSFLWDRFILLLFDPTSFVSFFIMQINRLPMLTKSLFSSNREQF